MTDISPYAALLGAVTTPLTTSRMPATSHRKLQSGTDADFLTILAQRLAITPSSLKPANTSAAGIEQLLSGVDSAKLEEIDTASREMESLILFTLLKQMWATVPESALAGSGMDSEIYREMWLEEMAKDISTNGQGIGIAGQMAWEMIYRELDSISPADLNNPARP